MKTMGLTTGEVVDRFIAGQVGGTRSAAVPGGRRLTSRLSGFGTIELVSYATVVAVRSMPGRADSLAVTSRKYSPTTTRMLNRLLAALGRAGFQPTEQAVPIAAKVPGRWGGWGPAWAPSDYETLPFTVWARASA